MGKVGKVIVFVIVSFVILIVLTLIKQTTGHPLIWLFGVAIPLIYISMFGKKNKQPSNESNEITLNKDKQNDKDITI